MPPHPPLPRQSCATQAQIVLAPILDRSGYRVPPWGFRYKIRRPRASSAAARRRRVQQATFAQNGLFGLCLLSRAIVTSRGVNWKWTLIRSKKQARFFRDFIETPEVTLSPEILFRFTRSAFGPATVVLFGETYLFVCWDAGYFPIRLG